MFKVILIVIVLLIAVVLILAAIKPDVFKVQRSIAINASAEEIFPHLNDFHSFTTWSPYEKKDPNMKRVFSGNASGVGAVYDFEGDGNVGTGKLAIVESTPPQKITMTLDFYKPFKANNTIQFTLVPAGDSTEVTWSMQGPTPFIGKIMHVFISMDAMVGKDFEAGLKSLKDIAEKE